MKALFDALLRLYATAIAFLVVVVVALGVVAHFRDAVPALVAVLVAVALVRIVWMRTRW